MVRFDAQAANNGLDWLSCQHQLLRADRTPSELVYRGVAFSVRHYLPSPGTRRTYDVPIVLVPPLAVRSSIVDLLPERSLVRYLLGHGFEMYLVDWDEPNRAHDELGLQAYALDMLSDALRAVRDYDDSRRVSLIGYCMGGLFTLLHAGTGTDDGIANIVSIATPVDMHDGTFAAALPKALQKSARMLGRRQPVDATSFDPALFHVSGKLNALAFKLSNPASGLAAMRTLLHNLDDREYVAANCTMRAWLNNMCDYPGALLRDFAIRIWINNEWANGPLHLDNTETDLRRIDCPVLAIAGETDSVVGQASTRRLLDRVASTDKTHIIAPGGHVGVLAGSGAPDYCWPRMADWLASRS